jgi:hypothetical protein
MPRIFPRNPVALLHINNLIADPYRPSRPANFFPLQTVLASFYKSRQSAMMNTLVPQFWRIPWRALS